MWVPWHSRATGGIHGKGVGPEAFTAMRRRADRTSQNIPLRRGSQERRSADIASIGEDFLRFGLTAPRRLQTKPVKTRQASPVSGALIYLDFPDCGLVSGLRRTCPAESLMTSWSCGLYLTCLGPIDNRMP
jgi:hypothetical protein